MLIRYLSAQRLVTCALAAGSIVLGTACADTGALAKNHQEALGESQGTNRGIPATPSDAVTLAAAFSTGIPSQSQAQAVATFESIGLYWKPNGGGEVRVCAVRYRRNGTADWQAGLPLWFDARDGECRGSLVHLTPDTVYDIELLEPASGKLAQLQARTWSENFPIGKTIFLPETSDRTLIIEESGQPDGYLLVTHRPGATATIDVSGRAESNIEIKGSYVIVRGLTLVNAARNAVVVDKAVHDVVIEENDISGWGRVSDEGWGEDRDSAVYSDYAGNAPLERVIIQRNRMHHPRAGANAWDEYRRSKNSSHPLGPHAISLWNTAGNHVIRYNEIYSDDMHKFNDCIGGGQNFGDRGFPHRDSDIYGNKISHCWDDAIESEGGNANVRIWGNYMDQTYVAIAVAATQTGPIYIWRNISDRSRMSATREMERAKRGVFLKAQSKHVGSNENRRYYGDGRIYVFHNTLVQRPGENHGVVGGLSDLSGMMTNITSRNNILHVNEDYRPSIADSERQTSHDFDYDLYNGKLNVTDGHERNGIAGVPIYDRSPGAATYALDRSSPGFDAGVILPNFNDSFMGAAPDIGAQEAGARPLEFGVDAYR